MKREPESLKGYILPLFMACMLTSCLNIPQIDYPKKVSEYLVDGNGRWTVNRWHLSREKEDKGVRVVRTDSMVQSSLRWFFSVETGEWDTTMRRGLLQWADNESDSFEWKLLGNRKDRKPRLTLLFADSTNFLGLNEVISILETWDEDVIDLQFEISAKESDGLSTVHRMKLRNEW